MNTTETHDLYDTVDLFAGPGGWSVAVAQLGLREYGVEWDHAACLTAQAAGHHRHEVDVRHVDPRGFAGIRLLIASPPCQGFSMAGLGAGRGVMPQLQQALSDLHRGVPVEDVRAALAEATHDDRVGLVVEPMHWIAQARPRNVVLEQVPAVLPLWEAMAGHMRELGYSVATGNLQAEQYDVPQTRKRAILVASLEREVALPAPVRAKYRKGQSPDPALPSWISMAEALGWGMTQRPYLVLASARFTGGPDREKLGGSGARKTLYAERDGGDWRRARVAEPDGAIRVSVTEAGILQGFPADYPWSGTATQRFRQISDAVPPPLGWHVIRAALGLPVEHYGSATELAA